MIIIIQIILIFILFIGLIIVSSWNSITITSIFAPDIRWELEGGQVLLGVNLCIASNDVITWSVDEKETLSMVDEGLTRRNN